MRKALRDGLSPKDKQLASSQLIHLLTASKIFQECTHICCYAPMLREEVDTLPLIHQVLGTDSYKSLYMPVMHNNQDIHMLRVRDMEDFGTFEGHRNPFGILEPPENSLLYRSNLMDDLKEWAEKEKERKMKGKQEDLRESTEDGGYVAKQQVSFVPRVLVVTPGLAFDLNGRRLGRGKGYYDRFIRSLRNLTRENNIPLTLIAPVFSCQIVEEVPAEPSHDENVDIVFSTTVTEPLNRL